MKRSLRVTGGMYGGRRITCPPGVIRPAMDRMRESVFAVLGDLSGSSFLDLFCGSGIIGIEAASRGASEITFVEMDKGKMTVLKANTAIIGDGTADVRIVYNPVERFLTSNRKMFDTIFADPPFNYAGKRRILQIVNRKASLAAGGRLLIHFPAEDPPPEKEGGLIMYDSRKYGRSIVGFYARVSETTS